LADGTIRGLAADNHNIFWISYISNNPITCWIGRADAQDNAIVDPKLIITSSQPWPIAINSRHVFFGHDIFAGQGGGQIWRANRDGTAIAPGIVKGIFNGPAFLAADIGHIYWTDASPWDATKSVSRANFDGSSVEIQFVEGLPAPNYGLAVTAIENVFVLMLENRSFDHILCGLNIEGVDAATGNPTKVNGVDPAETVNYYTGDRISKPYFAHSPALDPMPADPSHEYQDTMDQLATKSFDMGGGKSGSVVNGGFVDSYVEKLKNTKVKSSPGDVMANCDQSQIPVLYRLAMEFAVCDNWFGSVPGPTVPNRLFAMAGSSGGIDFSPDITSMLAWGTKLATQGVSLQNGSIFDRLSQNGYKYELYIDGAPYSVPGQFPVAAILRGIKFRTTLQYPLPNPQISNFKPVSSMVSQLEDPYNAYPNTFTWIEPNYGFEFKNGQSQHPCDDLADGEELIATVYNALRNSFIWERSVLIITYDEHGGFYDHVVPRPATPPGDTPFTESRFGCHFDQYGPRVPAVIVSPFIEKNTIDHSVYDHTSILKGTEDVLGLQPLTNRDRDALSPSAALSLGAPRKDCPTSLKANKKTAVVNDAETGSDDEPLPPPGMLDVMLYVAAKAEFELAGNNESKKRDAISRVEAVRTIGEAKSCGFRRSRPRIPIGSRPPIPI
jgi:phospholipase C